MENKKNKIIEYNIVRVIAVILVLVSHCTYYRILTNYGGIDYNIADSIDVTFLDKITRKAFTFFKDFLYLFHMPLFFALSGALFKNSINNKVKSAKELIVKKTKRLLIPFVIVIILFATPIKYLSNYFSNSSNILKDIFIGQILLQGNNYLWFLPTLFFNFIIIWLMRNKIENKNIKINMFFLILLNIVSPIIKIRILKEICCYLIYFYIGYCFEDYRTKFNEILNKKHFRRVCLEIILIIISLIVFNICDFKGNIYLKILKYILNLIMAFLGTYMIYLISYEISKTKISESHIVEKINEYSFGLYLYSDPLNYLILYIVHNIFGIAVFYTNPGIVLIFVARLLITFFAAWFITSFLRKKKVKYIC